MGRLGFGPLLGLQQQGPRGLAWECLQTGAQFRSGSAPLPIAPQGAKDSHQPLAAALFKQMRLCGVDL